MSQTTQANDSPRFPAGARLGRCTVVAYLGREALGERYAVFYGTTNHVLDLVVPPAGASSPTLEDYRAYMRKLVPVARHPALAHCFAAGTDPYYGPGSAAPSADEAAPQVPWLRTEHVPGAPQWTLKTQLDGDVLRSFLPPPGENEDATTREARENPDVANLDLFLGAAGCNADAAELGRLLADVLGALSALHHAKLPGGAPSAADVALDRTPHSATPVARLVRYGEGEWSGEAAAADLAAFATLLRRAECALPEGSPMSGKWEGFAAKIDSGAFPTATEAYSEYLAVLAGAGISPSAAPARSGGPSRQSSRSSAPERAQSRSRSSSTSRHHHHRHRSSSSIISGESEAWRRVRAMFGLGAFLAVIAAIGVAVYFYMTWTDMRDRERFASTFMADAPVVMVIPTEEENGEEESGAGATYHLSAPELASADASGKPFARARVAIADLLSAAPDAPDAATLARADAALKAVMPALLDAPQDDAAAAFMRGTAALLALGKPQEPQVAWQELETSAKAGFPLASVLFGDLLCGGADRAAPAGAPSRIASMSPARRDERALDFYRAAADALDTSADIRRGAEDRIVAILRRAPKPAGARFVDKWRPWVLSAAEGGNVNAMALLAVSGPFCATNEIEALRWLRRVNTSPASTPAVKAWAQTRMAARFARGVGAPASESAARIWYERAAILGNPVAMRRWADYLESGQGDPNGLGNPAEAAAWREKIKTAAPEPDFSPAWFPTSRPVPRDAGADGAD